MDGTAVQTLQCFEHRAVTPDEQSIGASFESATRPLLRH
jgi:hypothetical protein